MAIGLGGCMSEAKAGRVEVMRNGSTGCPKAAARQVVGTFGVGVSKAMRFRSRWKLRKHANENAGGLGECTRN